MNIQIHNLHIYTHNRTQYKQLHTKFIHLLHTVGIGTSQDGTSISSNKCVTEVTIEISQRLRFIGFPQMARRVATCEKASGPHAPSLYCQWNTFPTQWSTFCVIFRMFPELSCSCCNARVHARFHNNTRIERRCNSDIEGC